MKAYFEYLAELDAQDFMLFRGHQSERFSLLPKLARLVIDGPLRTVENEMMDALKRQAIPFLGHQPADMWDWLAIAQHHGLATRLLDWTQNPLVALWFAVERPPLDKSGGALWVFKPTDKNMVLDFGEDPFNAEYTKVFRPKHVSQRIRAQGGCFTLHKYLEPQNAFIPLEKQTRYRKRLTKLAIPAEVFSQLRLELDRCGINQFSVYPDIDGLCRHIEWQHSRLDDEREDSLAVKQGNPDKKRATRHQMKRSPGIANLAKENS